jgi:hypothetical protein
VAEGEQQKIPAGENVLVIRTPKGVYIRTPKGKIFAVRSAIKTSDEKPSQISPQKSGTAIILIKLILNQHYYYNFDYTCKYIYIYICYAKYVFFPDKAASENKESTGASNIDTSNISITSAKPKEDASKTSMLWTNKASSQIIKHSPKIITIGLNKMPSKPKDDTSSTLFANQASSYNIGSPNTRILEANKILMRPDEDTTRSSSGANQISSETSDESLPSTFSELAGEGSQIPKFPFYAPSFSGSSAYQPWAQHGSTDFLKKSQSDTFLGNTERTDHSLNSISKDLGIYFSDDSD